MEVNLEKVATVFDYCKPLIVKQLGQFFLASKNDIYAFSLSTSGVLHCLKKHTDKVIAIRRNPFNNKSILSCDTNGNVISWAHEGDVENNKMFSLKTNGLTAFFDVLENGFFLVGNNSEELYILSSLDDCGSLLMPQVRQQPNMIVSNGSMICAVASYSFLVAKYPTDGKYIWQRHSLKYEAVCLACHPHNDTLAVGGQRGIIAIYSNVTSENPTIKNLYWHFLPVGDLCFNRTGNELYSGGGESVLKKWILSDECKEKISMSRLGGPIKYLAVEGDQVVISHTDNDISIYNGETKAVNKGDNYIISLEESGCNIFLRHESTNLIITNGLTGYLQFYSPEASKRKYQLDITLENYMVFTKDEEEQRRFVKIIQAVAVSEDGSWIVTYEQSVASSTLEQHNVKFWNYSASSQKWQLNRLIKAAHSDRILSLTLSKEHSSNYYCVSCSKDQTAKIWTTYHTDDEHVSWSLHAVKEYRKLTPRNAAFHADMSLMAIAFNDSVVVYETEKMLSIQILHYDECEDNILEIQFTSQENGPFLVTRTATALIICNYTTNERLRFDVDSSCMAINPSTDIVAIFKRNLPFVYLLHIHENCISNKLEIAVLHEYSLPHEMKVAAALWVPIKNNFILHIKTSSQDVFKLDGSKDELTNNIIKPNVLHTETPFSRLLSTTQTSLVQNQKANTEYLPPIKNWLSEKISGIHIGDTDSFSELLTSLTERILPDL